MKNICREQLNNLVAALYRDVIIVQKCNYNTTYKHSSLVIHFGHEWFSQWCFISSISRSDCEEMVQVS